MNDPKLPPMVGTLSTLPEHVQEVVKSYARAAIAINRRAAVTPSAPTAVEPDVRAERDAFQAWANREGYDTAYNYDTERSRWVFFNPMTADLFKAWRASKGAP